MSCSATRKIFGPFIPCPIGGTSADRTVLFVNTNCIYFQNGLVFGGHISWQFSSECMNGQTRHHLSMCIPLSWSNVTPLTHTLSLSRRNDLLTHVQHKLIENKIQTLKFRKKEKRISVIKLVDILPFGLFLELLELHFLGEVGQYLSFSTLRNLI